ncbi:MAG: SDR family oxidoreductase [Myxococcales bacterium]|nr:SDR family oxidoreductase [Myxococcales bacterium]
MREPHPPFPKQNIHPPGLESNLTPRPRYMAVTYKAAGKLKDKVAFVTGGDSGIGRAVCVLFAREGANVAFTYLPEEQADAEETEQVILNEGGRALPIALDVRQADDAKRALKAVVDAFGKLDILINNAAFQNHCDDPEKLTFEQWDRTFKTNIYGYFHMVKAALPHLKKGAAIINTGSITGLEGSKNLLDYAATKGAIHAFTKSLAKSLITRGIRVNCVAPGPVWTPLNPAERSDEEIRNFGADMPIGRPAQPEEIAPAYVFFASDADSSYVTGEVLTLLGGNTTAA